MSLSTIDRSRAGWWAFGTGLAAALVFVLYSFVGTFVFGLFLYYATRPIYRRIRRRVRHPGVAAAVALFALALPALLLVAYALLVVVNQAGRLINNGFDVARLPGVDPALVERFGDPQLLLSGGLPQNVSSASLHSLLASLNSAAGTLAFVGVGLLHLFIIVAIAFYLLRDDHRLSRWFMQRFGDERDVVEAYFRAVDSDFHSIFFGNILNAALTGAIGVLSYTLLNTIAPPGLAIPAAALVGLLAGVASLIPVVGMKLVYFPVALYMAGVAVLVGRTRALWFVGIFAATSFVVVDTIPDLVLRPYVSGRSLHVGAVMLAYTFGPLLFGWYGIFLMPMLLVLTVHFARLVLPELLAGRPLQPYAVDPSYLTGERPSSALAASDSGTGDGATGSPPTADTKERSDGERRPERGRARPLVEDAGGGTGDGPSGPDRRPDATDD
ncbi:MAG: AI-2E family transporter [Salinigranum sp.]